MLYDRKMQIDHVNKVGGDFLWEAQRYDKLLERYQRTMDELLGAGGVYDRDGKRARLQPGTDDVQREMDQINNTYTDVITVVSDRIKAIKAALERCGRKVQVCSEHGMSLVPEFASVGSDTSFRF